ncbi:hypothetical protein QJS04_geneDACA001166 [Acorus gramineus]|uniref:DUF7792 domain-containing protein n=1 Tax=Acorus gramineus TaxID=55184 RepID=A0AAV9ADZ8_ACOGR|nr:hypothetical protein QJS04_geneDACA001166 [Acorus gramineus]
MMGDGVKQILTKPIQLADQVTKVVDDAHLFKQECFEIKSKTERLATLLRQAARADLYERPTRRIMDDTGQVLEKALQLVLRCRSAGLVKRLFTLNPGTAFKKMSSQLENSIGDVSWLLRVSAAASDDDDGYLGLPPIAANEPILCLIWEPIATLHTASTLEKRCDAAASLVSLARDNDRYGKLIIEEGGVGPLLRLVKEGKPEGQEYAARALGLLGRDPESVEQMVNAGACTVFAKVLKEGGSMRVQAVVAEAVSELAAHGPSCQDMFAKNNVIRLLVGHLAFETVQEHSKYAIASQHKSIHSIAAAAATTNNSIATASSNHDDDERRINHPMGNQHNAKNQMHSVVQSTMAAKSNTRPKNPPQQQQQQQNLSLAGQSIKGREYEDPETKLYMKAMAAKALWKLARGNAAICKSITESKALLCFAVLLEKGPGEEVQYNSAMALMEIARVAESDADLRQSAFKPNSPAARAVVDQMLRVVELAEPGSSLLVPCVIALGCLARTFRATETRVIGPLVGLLDDREEYVERAATVALTKFACTENYLHVNHARAILEKGGAKHLVQLVYLGEQAMQVEALKLLCYVAQHVPESEALAEANVLPVLEWASKQGFMVQDPTLDMLLPEAKGRLELYQSRSRH